MQVALLEHEKNAVKVLAKTGQCIYLNGVTRMDGFKDKSSGVAITKKDAMQL